MMIGAFLIGSFSFLGCYLVLQRVEQNQRLQNRLEKLRIGSLQIQAQASAAGKGQLLRSRKKVISDAKKMIRMICFGLMLGAASFLYSPPPFSYPVITVCLMIVVYYGSLLLSQRRYQGWIRRDLPGTLDLLVICMGSGLGINASFERVSKEMGKTPLGSELRQVVNEANTGIPLEESLRNFSDYAQIPEVNAVMGAIIQAHKSGVSLVETLQIQASSLREKMKLQAKEKIMKLPILVLFPMVFFIFPVIFIIVLGPAMLSFMGTF